MKKTLKIIGFIVLIIALWFLNLAKDAGTFKTLTPHFNGKITVIKGVVGVEDLTIDQETGLAFLSSEDRWKTYKNHDATKGAIYLLNLNDSLPKPINLTANFAQKDFHPHGLSLFKDTDGQRYLFVISHRKAENVVEVFKFQGDSLTHIESIADKTWMISPNDLVAVGKRQFYFTNDHDKPLSFWRNIGDYLQLKTGQVIYFDGKSYSKQAENIQYANGINVSLDGKTLFLAATAGRKIYVFNREIASGKLIQTDVLDVDTGVDNIEIAPDGALWIGCHPKLLAFTQHAASPKALSPSQVLRVVYKGKGDFTKEEIYLNDGSEISGSSVGTVFGKKLLIGSVFQDRVLLGE